MTSDLMLPDSDSDIESSDCKRQVSSAFLRS